MGKIYSKWNERTSLFEELNGRGKPRARRSNHSETHRTSGQKGPSGVTVSNAIKVLIKEIWFLNLLGLIF
jgi:hypothetical protein